jgi:glycosyltransferase involved in cell wall biosynthesis
MRVKVLEALAAGKPVVATSLAIEGLDVENGRQVVLAESDQEFSRAAIELLRAPALRTRLAREAHTWACANLSWEKTVASYEDLYYRMLRDDCQLD